MSVICRIMNFFQVWVVFCFFLLQTNRSVPDLCDSICDSHSSRLVSRLRFKDSMYFSHGQSFIYLLWGMHSIFFWSHQNIPLPACQKFNWLITCVLRGPVLNNKLSCQQTANYSNGKAYNITKHIFWLFFINEPDIICYYLFQNFTSLQLLTRDVNM